MNTIELLKSQLLKNVSNLYEDMLSREGNDSSNLDILSDIIIMTYLLAEEMGSSKNGLDVKINNRLKLAIINGENNQWTYELKHLKEYFDENKK